MGRKIRLLTLVLIFVIFISGCIDGGFTAEQIAKGSKEVKEFLKDYPRATFVASLLDNETIEGMIAGLRDTCGEQMKVKNYWRVKVQDPDTEVTIIAWVDVDNKQTVCIIKNGELLTEEQVKQCKVYEKATGNLYANVPILCDSEQDCIKFLKEYHKYLTTYTNEVVTDFDEYLAENSVKCEKNEI